MRGPNFFLQSVIEILHNSKKARGPLTTTWRDRPDVQHHLNNTLNGLKIGLCKTYLIHVGMKHNPANQGRTGFAFDKQGGGGGRGDNRSPGQFADYN